MPAEFLSRAGRLLVRVHNLRPGLQTALDHNYMDRIFEELAAAPSRIPSQEDNPTSSLYSLL